MVPWAMDLTPLGAGSRKRWDGKPQNAPERKTVWPAQIKQPKDQSDTVWGVVSNPLDFYLNVLIIHYHFLLLAY